MAFPGITPEEIAFLQRNTDDLTDDQKTYFYISYSSGRKKSTDLMIFTLIGAVGIAGIQRFAVGQNWMGTLYLLTFGLCGIGSLVDFFNCHWLAMDYNMILAVECHELAKVSSG